VIRGGFNLPRNIRYRFLLGCNGTCPPLPASASTTGPKRGTSTTPACALGVIVERSGGANTAEPWQWICGFYPGSPGDERYGTAASFETVRSAFEAAWQEYLPKRSEADFQAWRDEEAWTERKYAMRARGERLPSQMPSSLMRCPCGETFDSHKPECNLIHVPHITAAVRAHEIRRTEPIR
jgi:hypothetical protein